MVGIVNTAEALTRAREVDLDLVEISPEADPPVCRILDYGKFRYELSKKEKATKAKSKAVEMKEVRLGRSMKIDPHDVEIRLRQARQFLMEGHKVQIVQNFRGREVMHRDRGEERMKAIIEQLSDISRIEAPPRQAGKRLSMILSPDRAKVEQARRRAASLLAREQRIATPGPTPASNSDGTEEPGGEVIERLEHEAETVESRRG